MACKLATDLGVFTKSMVIYRIFTCFSSIGKKLLNSCVTIKKP